MGQKGQSLHPHDRGVYVKVITDVIGRQKAPPLIRKTRRVAERNVKSSTDYAIPLLGGVKA